MRRGDILNPVDIKTWLGRNYVVMSVGNFEFKAVSDMEITKSHVNKFTIVNQPEAGQGKVGIEKFVAGTLVHYESWPAGVNGVVVAFNGYIATVYLQITVSFSEAKQFRKYVPKT